MELFPGIPTEIGWQCLLRVPFKHHYKLRAVCKNWKSTVESPLFYQDRKQFEACEEFVVALTRSIGEAEFTLIVYDPLQNSCQLTLPRIPNKFDVNYSHFCRCVFVHHKVIVMGLPERDYRAGNTGNAVMVFDIFSGQWKRGADMPVCRNFFSCSVSPQTETQHIYIAGGWMYFGIGRDDAKAFSEAAVYNVEDNRWAILPDMENMEFNVHCICHSFFMDGNFFVVGDEDAEVYDPKDEDGNFFVVGDEDAEVYDPSDVEVYGKFFENFFVVGDEDAEVYDPKDEDAEVYDAKEAREWTLVKNMCRDIDRHGQYAAVFGRLYCFELRRVKEYNSMENKWSVVGLFPQGLRRVDFATKWSNGIFVSGIDCNDDIVFYLFVPPALPPPAAGDDNSNSEKGKWSALLHAGFSHIYSIATMQI